MRSNWTVTKNSYLASTMVLLMSAMAVLPVAGQELLPTPSLLTNEVFGYSKNGCGIVLNTQGQTMIKTYVTHADGKGEIVEVAPGDYIKGQMWVGACKGGLASGWGKFGPPGANGGVASEFWPEQEYAWGRATGRMRNKNEITYFLNAADGTRHNFSLKNLGTNGAALPRWASSIDDLDGNSALTYGKVNVRTETSNCVIDSQHLRGCSGEGYQVYGVTVQQSGSVTYHWCPKPTSSAGCNDLWQQQAGDMLNHARADLAQWQQEEQAKEAEYKTLDEPWMAQQAERDAAHAAEVAQARATATSQEELARLAREAAEADPLTPCRQLEDASTISRQLAKVPQNNINLQTRGIITAADFMIGTYSKCLPDARAQQIVGQFQATRKAALENCRAFTTEDNCLVPPFGPAYEADLQQRAAARRQVAEEAAQNERDAQAIHEAIQSLIDAVQEIGKRRNGGDDAENSACSGIVCQ